MAKFRVVLTERLIDVYEPVEIEADTETQAEELAEEMRVQGELVVSSFVPGDCTYQIDAITPLRPGAEPHD